AGAARVEGLILGQADLPGGHARGQGPGLLLAVADEEVLQRAGEAVGNAVGAGQERPQAGVLEEGQQGADATSPGLVELGVSGQDDTAKHAKATRRLEEVTDGIGSSEVVVTPLPVVEGRRGNLMLGGEGAQRGLGRIVDGLVNQGDDLDTVPTERLLAI